MKRTAGERSCCDNPDLLTRHCPEIEYCPMVACQTCGSVWAEEGPQLRFDSSEAA